MAVDDLLVTTLLASQAVIRDLCLWLLPAADSP